MKLSKKDQTNESIAAEAAATFALLERRSEHFALGTAVVVANERARVISRPGEGYMKVRYTDGSTEILRPYALAYER